MVPLAYSITELKEHDNLILDIYKNYNDNHIKINASVLKHLGDGKVMLNLGYTSNKVLNFSSVTVDAYATLDDNTPVVWRKVRIAHLNHHYVLCIDKMGTKTNRRSSYRVSIGSYCWITSLTCGRKQVLLKDLSLAGFSITDRKQELNLQKGEMVNLVFEDLLYDIKLDGKLVRIEEHEGYTIYGFTITSLCKELAPYLNLKQTKRQ